MGGGAVRKRSVLTNVEHGIWEYIMVLIFLVEFLYKAILLAWIRLLPNSGLSTAVDREAHVPLMFCQLPPCRLLLEILR